MGLNYCASSPVLVLPPAQPPSHYFVDTHGTHSRGSTPPAYANYANEQATNIKRAYKHPTPPSMNYQAAIDTRLAGRKRSRADIADDDTESPEDGAVVRSQSPKAQPIYGPGMTLIYPDDPGYQVSAESQTGTWLEEKQPKASTTSPRPIVSSRKSQRRLDTSSQPLSSPCNLSPHLQPDEAVLARIKLILGISWKPIPESLSIAVRGYERFINNHYSFGDPYFLLYNEALQVYLVRTTIPTEAYRLVSEDLRHSQAVGYTEDMALAALSQAQIGADGKPTFTYVEEPIHALLATPPASPAEPLAPVQAPSASEEDIEMEL